MSRLDAGLVYGNSRGGISGHADSHEHVRAEHAGPCSSGRKTRTVSMQGRLAGRPPHCTPPPGARGSWPGDHDISHPRKAAARGTRGRFGGRRGFLTLAGRSGQGGWGGCVVPREWVGPWWGRGVAGRGPLTGAYAPSPLQRRRGGGGSKRASWRGNAPPRGRTGRSWRSRGRRLGVWRWRTTEGGEGGHVGTPFQRMAATRDSADKRWWPRRGAGGRLAAEAPAGSRRGSTWHRRTR